MKGASRMFSNETLKKMTVKQLKDLAQEEKVSIPAKAKKADIIKLILESQKVLETAQEKRSELGSNPSSQTAQQPFYDPQGNAKEDYFNSIPELPGHYGRNKLVFMIRDPQWGFVYWEMNESLINEHNLNNKERFLRVYDISESGSPERTTSFFDIKLDGMSHNWYIKLAQANRTFIVDLGYFQEGRFITVLRSNPGTTPRDAISDQLDQEWMMNDKLFAKIMGASGADSLFQQNASQELMKFISANINESLSSGSISSANVSSFGISSNMNR